MLLKQPVLLMCVFAVFLCLLATLGIGLLLLLLAEPLLLSEIVESF